MAQIQPKQKKSRTADPPYPRVTLTHGPNCSYSHQQHSHSTECGKNMWLLYGNHEQTQRHQRHSQNDEPIAVWLVLGHGRRLRQRKAPVQAWSFKVVSLRRWRSPSRAGVTDRAQDQLGTKIRIIEPVMGLGQVTFPQAKLAVAWAIVLQSFQEYWNIRGGFPDRDYLKPGLGTS